MYYDKYIFYCISESACVYKTLRDTLRSFFKPTPISSQENGTIPPSPQNKRGDLVVLGLWRYVVRCSIFLFPLRPNLNLCSRDSYPYTDKRCMNSREERSHDGPPGPPRSHEWIESWIYIGSHLNRPHLSSWGGVWFQTPVQTEEVRHANVPWMVHISGLGTDEHIELFMWLIALTVQAQRHNYQGRALPLS